MKLAVKILKYFLVSFFVLSVASSQSYTQAEVLEMIKERDLQWQGKVDNANNLIASQKEVGNLKRKLTNSKKKTKQMEEVYEKDEVESAEEFLRKFAKSK